jgi:hypothetical protein
MTSVGERMGLLRPAQREVVGEDGRLTVSRTSIFTGRRNAMTLPITRGQLARWDRREGLAQDIFPDLGADQREFLMSGATPEEWVEVFGKNEEDDG